VSWAVLLADFFEIASSLPLSGPQAPTYAAPSGGRARQHLGDTTMQDLKAGGYKVVFMKPKAPATTIASYAELILKTITTSGADGRPTSSVVRTISE